MCIMDIQIADLSVEPKNPKNVYHERDCYKKYKKYRFPDFYRYN